MPHAAPTPPANAPAARRATPVCTLIALCLPLLFLFFFERAFFFPHLDQPEYCIPMSLPELINLFALTALLSFFLAVRALFRAERLRALALALVCFQGVIVLYFVVLFTVGIRH